MKSIGGFMFDCYRSSHGTRANPYVLAGFCEKCREQIVNCATQTLSPNLEWFAKDANKRHVCKEAVS